jgi:hypothetical protein
MGAHIRPRQLGWVILIVSLLAFNAVRPVSAEPGYGVSCAPSNPGPGCPPKPKVVTGQVLTGNSQVYCADENDNTVVLMTDPSQVFFSYVKLPNETVISFVAVVAYYPSHETYGYVNLPSSANDPWTVMAGGGPHRVSGPVSFGPTDPEGEYLRTAFVWYTDGATWKYAESEASCPTWTYRQHETTTQAETVTSTVTTVIGEQNPTTSIGAMLGIFVAIALLGLNMVIVLATRRKPTPST